MAEQPRPHIPTEYLWVTRKFGQNDDIGTASDPETLWTLSNGLFPWDTFSGVGPNIGGLEAEIFKWWASVGRGGNSTTAEVQLRTQAPGKAWRVRQVAHSSNGAPYIMPMEGDAALQVPAGTRIELQIAEVTANNTAVTGGFWLGWRRKTRGHYSRSTVYPTTEVP